MPLKLNLGSGNDAQAKREGWTNVDRLKLPNVDVQLDLEKMPWPWKDGEVGEIAAKHLLEHLHGTVGFMDECHRVLRPGGTLYLEVPDAADPDLAWADPTHVRPFRVHTFVNYFTPAGVEQFGYTHRAWCMLAITTDGHVIRAHMMPIREST